MPRVAVASCATIPFVRNSGKSVAELAAEPCTEILLNDSSVHKDIDGVLISSCSNDQYLGPIVSEMLGLKPNLTQRIDNLCNSGTSAIVSAYSLIASGVCESVLVSGAEKKDSPGNRLLWDVTRGSYSFPVHWGALYANAHMRRYGTTEEQLATISARNRTRALMNPNALFHKPINVQDVMASKTIIDPLKLLDCSAACDGASAVLLVSESIARKLENPIWLIGIGQQTSSASFANATTDLTSIDAAVKASKVAFQMSDLTPSKIDVAEIHDAFSILELLAIEDMGFAEKGKGFEFLDESPDRINPRGGILGSGHPLGATGVAQVAEVATQLMGTAGRRQVDSCRYGLVHNLSAAGSSATVLILGNQC